MNNCSETSPAAERDVRTPSSDVARNHFKNRTLCCDCKFKLPMKRYVMGLLLGLLSALELLRSFKVYNILDIYYNWAQTKKQTDPEFETLSLDFINNVSHAIYVGDIFVNMLGGLLIYRFSSHRFLLVSVAFTSILHILTPTAVFHQSLAFHLFVRVGQEISSISVSTAILSVWKDWAPPDERTVLVTISLLGFATGSVAFLYFFFDSEDMIPDGVSTYIGVASIIWVLLWYLITFSSPQCDPLITEKEYCYLESKIPSHYQEKSSLKDVPWLSMVRCKQVILLFLVFFKLACSMESLYRSGIWIIQDYSDKLYERDFKEVLQKIMYPFFITFICVLLVNCIHMDIVLKKREHGKALIIRKAFMCTGFVMQSVFLMVAVMSDAKFVRAVCYATAYVCFAISVPGVLRLPLDLAPSYVSVIAGFGFAFFSLGKVCIRHLDLSKFSSTSNLQKYWETPLLICDLVITLFTAIVFGVWGEVEEQSWSLRTSPRQPTNDGPTAT